MFEEDAVAAMEELGHAFFVFVNAETERLTSSTSATTATSALIEPIIGGEYTHGRGAEPGARPAGKG